MKRATIAGGTIATVVILLALAAGYRALEPDVDPAATSPAVTPPGPGGDSGRPPQLPVRSDHHN